MKTPKNKILASFAICLIFATLALACSDDTSTTVDQGSADAVVTEADVNAIGNYSVEIDSCRLAKDYEGKDVVIVKYKFSNVSGEDPISFMVAFDDYASQSGVGLNESWVVDESANYSSDNQTKEIKKGASLDVEVAYELNDSTTPVDIEVKELFSFDEKTLTKTFEIAE